MGGNDDLVRREYQALLRARGTDLKKLQQASSRLLKEDAVRHGIPFQRYCRLHGLLSQSDWTEVSTNEVGIGDERLFDQGHHWCPACQRNKPASHDALKRQYDSGVDLEPWTYQQAETAALGLTGEDAYRTPDERVLHPRFVSKADQWRRPDPRQHDLILGRRPEPPQDTGAGEEALEGHLRDLGLSDQDVALLIYLGRELTVREIARLLGWSRSATARRVDKALDNYRAATGQDFPVPRRRGRGWDKRP